MYWCPSDISYAKAYAAVPLDLKAYEILPAASVSGMLLELISSIKLKISPK